MGMLGAPVGGRSWGLALHNLAAPQPLARGPLHTPFAHSLLTLTPYSHSPLYTHSSHTHFLLTSLCTCSLCTLAPISHLFPCTLVPLFPYPHSLPLHILLLMHIAHTCSPSMIVPFGSLLPWSTVSLCTLVPLHTCFHMFVPTCPCTLDPFSHLLSLCAHSPCLLVPLPLSQCLLVHSPCTPQPSAAWCPSRIVHLAHSLPPTLAPCAHSLPLLICFLYTYSALAHSPFPYTLPIALHTPSLPYSSFSPAPFILSHAPHSLLHSSFPFPCTLPALHTCCSQRAMRPNKRRERFIPFAPRIPNPPPNTGSGVQACPPQLELCFSPMLWNPRFGVPPTRTEAPFPRIAPPPSRVIFATPCSGSFSLSSLPLPKVSSQLPGPPVYSQIPGFFVCPAVIFHQVSKSVNSRIAHLKTSCPGE